MMRSQIDRSSFFIMRILYESDSGLQPYTLLMRSKLSGEIFLKVFKSLTLRGLVVEKNLLISLSKKGLEVFLADSTKILSGPKEWRKVPVEMLGRRIDVDEFYTPNIFLLRT